MVDCFLSRNTPTTEMDQIFNAGRNVGNAEGNSEMAISFAKMGIPLDKIAEAAKVDVEQIRELVMTM